jgi:hypothetical protein
LDRENDRDMSRPKVADVIVATLAAAGAKRCYGVAGDTLNFITDAIRRSDVRWVHVRHEEAGGFAAGAEALLTGNLTLCAGSCGPGSLHFINGLFDAHRNRSPVVLIASQITRDELGFDFPQEIDFRQVYQACSVFCEEIRTPAQAARAGRDRLAGAPGTGAARCRYQSNGAGDAAKGSARTDIRHGHILGSRRVGRTQRRRHRFAAREHRIGRARRNGPQAYLKWHAAEPPRATAGQRTESADERLELRL